MQPNRFAFRTAFNFYAERLGTLANTPEWWENTARQMEALANGDPLLSDLLVDVYGELERRAHEQQGQRQRRGA